jgi:hypothetical protein
MPLNRKFAAFVLFALVTVEFGGWSLLGFLTSESSLTSFQEQFFRAGHGHAGVLLVMALVFFVLMDRTDTRAEPNSGLASPCWQGFCCNPADSFSTCSSETRVLCRRAPGLLDREPFSWRSL